MDRQRSCRSLGENRGAFTLIELLIVVAIIGILAAIAIPNFLEARVRAKVASVRSDMRTLGMAAEMYAADHNEYPPHREQETCTELQIMSVLKVVGGGDAHLIRRLLGVLHLLSTNLVGEGGHALIINGRKLTESDFQETTIIELLARDMDVPEEEVHLRLNSISNTLGSLSRVDLYRRDVDLNAIGWIKGLLSPIALSFVHISRNGAIKFGLKRITPLGYQGTPVKILDATGDARALKFHASGIL